MKYLGMIAMLLVCFVNQVWAAPRVVLAESYYQED